MHTINKHTLMYTENQFSIEATENNLQKSCVHLFMVLNVLPTIGDS